MHRRDEDRCATRTAERGDGPPYQQRGAIRKDDKPGVKCKDQSEVICSVFGAQRGEH